VSRPALGPTQPSSYSLDTGVKGPGRDDDYSPPSNVQVNNEWNYISVTLICLHDMDMNNFTFNIKVDLNVRKNDSFIWKIIINRYYARGVESNSKNNLRDMSVQF